MTEDSMHRTLREALARNSGPSAEDVEAVSRIVAAIDGDAWEDLGERGQDACLRAARAVLASDWLAAHAAAAEARGAERGARAVVEAVEAAMALPADTPFRAKKVIADAAREAAARITSPEVCSTCGGAFDSPPCSLNREIGWSGHTRSGGAATGTRVEGGA